jgi:hypothetical protein
MQEVIAKALFSAAVFRINDQLMERPGSVGKEYRIDSYSATEMQGIE